MWKVVLMICSLGNPCVVMEEDPMKHYNKLDDCLAVAHQIEADVIATFTQYGYAVTETSANCEQDPNAL